MKILLFSLMLVLSACGKQVASESNPIDPLPPVGSPGIVTDGQTGTALLTFADHTQYGSVVQDVTSITFTESMALVLSNTIRNTATQTGYSFDPNDSHAYVLDVYLNSQRVCSYQWTGSAYSAITGCQLAHAIHVGDKVRVLGIPVRESITVNANYLK